MTDNVIETINGISLNTQPLRDGGYQVITSDLLSDGSGRTAETGTTLRYPVRTGVFKLMLRFKGKSDDIAQVNSLVMQFTQTVRFLWQGAFIEKTMYPGDRTLTDNGETAELSVNLIEV